VTDILHKELSYAVVGAAQEVHRLLGPGFLEAIYEEALAHELTFRSISYERQKLLTVNYKGLLLGEYRADSVIEEKIILEIKAMTGLTPAHESQALHYLAATGLRLALLLNFGRESLQMRRIIH